MIRTRNISHSVVCVPEVSRGTLLLIVTQGCHKLEFASLSQREKRSPEGLASSWKWYLSLLLSHCGHNESHGPTPWQRSAIYWVSCRCKLEIAGKQLLMAFTILLVVFFFNGLHFFEQF